MSTEAEERVAKAIRAKVPLGYGMTEAEALEYARAAIAAVRAYDAETLNRLDALEDRLNTLERRVAQLDFDTRPFGHL